MNLTISLRVPEGIVLGADTMLIISAQPPPKEDFIKCPTCTTKIPYSKIIPPPQIPIPISTHVRKLFCIKKLNIGIASFGHLFIGTKSLSTLLLEFEKRLTGDETVEETATSLAHYFKRILQEEINLSKLQDTEYIISLQVAGYDKQDFKIGKTYLVKVGKREEIEAVHLKGYGCTFGGDGRVIQKLWKEELDMPAPLPNFNLLTLHDAIDYVMFLMNTTIEFQRFAPMMPTCGGEIEICVITPKEGFKWIKHREL